MGLFALDQRVNHVLDFAIHKRGRVVGVLADAVVGDSALREVVGSDLLASVAATDLPLSDARSFGVQPILLGLKQLGAENFHRLEAVLLLATLVLARDDDAAWFVNNANRRLVLLHVLTARRACPEGRDFEIVIRDFDVNFFSFGKDGHGGRRSVDPA